MQVKTRKIRHIVRSSLESTYKSGTVMIAQPVAVRLFHWGFASSMIVLLITGYELHKPSSFLAVSFSQTFGVHVTAAWLCLGFFAYRIADAILRKDKSYFVTIRELKNLPKLIGYYLFFREKLPPQDKYDIGEKLVFLMWFFVFAIASLFGFTSYYSVSILNVSYD